MTRPWSLPAMVRHNSTFCGTITGVLLAGCDRNSAEIVDHPSPADDRRSVEVGYFLAPCVWRSIEIPQRRQDIYLLSRSSAACDIATGRYFSGRHSCWRVACSDQLHLSKAR